MSTLLLPALRPRAAGTRRIGTTSQRSLVAISALIAAALLAPLALLILQARTVGWHVVDQQLFRDRTATLLRHTVALTVLVALASLVVGVAAAWCTERCALPGKRLWTALLVIPIAIPDFVVGYAWHSIAPHAPPLGASVLVMTLGTYPLVYLPVAASLRRADPAMEEMSWSLGIGRVKTFFTVTLPLLRTALIGGGVLVALTVLSEYGAFEILRYQTFTTDIFTELGTYGPQVDGIMCLPLVLLGLLILSIDFIVPRRDAPRAATRGMRRIAMSPMTTIAVIAGLVLVVGLGVGVPIGTVVYWMNSSQHTTLPAVATVGQAAWATIRFSAVGALIAVAMALPVAMMTFRRATASRLVLERSTFLTQAVPGVAIALALTFLASHFFRIYEPSSVLLVAAYAILHFPLALACVKASVAQAPPQLADVGRSLGRGSTSVFFRVTLPLLAPGLLAGFCLVFLTAVTELTATLLLVPFGVQTLATQFWAFTYEGSYGAAAPYALVIIVLAVIPGALLGLWFDRDPMSARPAS